MRIIYSVDTSGQRIQARLEQLLEIARRYENREYPLANLEGDIAHGAIFVYSMLKSGATEAQLRRDIQNAKLGLSQLPILVLEEMAAKGIQEFEDSPSSKYVVTY